MTIEWAMLATWRVVNENSADMIAATMAVLMLASVMSVVLNGMNRILRK